ncbi:MAG TPA: DUF1801 domain-containing protein [Rhizomicrobium sp.]
MRGVSAASSVEAYLKRTKPPVRSKLDQLRALIQAAAPSAEEGISYGMPFYKYLGRSLCGFALFKNHIGFFPGAIVSDFTEDLEGYKVSKGTVRLPLDRPIPVTLIRRMLKAAMARNSEKAVTKAGKSAKSKKLTRSPR